MRIILRHVERWVFFFISQWAGPARFKVLEMNTNGTLYLHKTSFLCTREIAKRLTEGEYQLAEPSNLGNKLQTLF